MLGVPDAYELPSAPGNGYLKEATEGLVRFKAAYVSGAYTKRSRAGGRTAASRPRTQVLPYQRDTSRRARTSRPDVRAPTSPSRRADRPG